MDAEREGTTGERETRARTLVTGLDEHEVTLTAAAYFARFAWAPRTLDPDRMTAAEFFDAW